MGFDLYGVSPMNVKGEYFRNNVWWWRGLQLLVQNVCSDILSGEELNNLGWNNGYEYSEEKAKLIAERLKLIVDDRELLNKYEDIIMFDLEDYHQGCWSKDNITDFIKFLENSGGFTVC